MKFEKLAQDSESSARCGLIYTDHGNIETPIFMPVGTLGTVKAVYHRDLDEDIKAQIILGNTYHLYLRPGIDIINKAGGLHKFISWNKPILTDSGGYQVFSLAANRKLREEGCDFSSHIDGSKHFFSPENVVDIQRKIGADIIMALDECPPGDSDWNYASKSLILTQKWLERGIARCVLLGKRQAILAACAKINLKLHEQIEIIEPQNIIDKYIEPLCEARRAKKLTPEAARKQLEDNVVLGTMMLHLGEVDGLVSGAIHTTANTIRPALQIIKTAPNVKLVSSIFFMCLPDQVLVYGDCAINPNPSAEELADIAIQSADSAAAFGITPRVAMLSYSTGASGFGPDVSKVKAATELAKLLRADLEIDGPLQYDAAIDKAVAALKAPDSKVAGRATVFIFPNLDVGNISYKTVQRSTGIVCIGPMLQGLRKPVNDLSRGCSVSDIIFTIAITAVQVQ